MDTDKAYIEKCCDNILDIIDGKHGWTQEIIALAFIVVLNFAIAYILKRLHHKFSKERRYWQDTFVKGLHKPLSFWIWFVVFVNSLDVINIRLNGTNFFSLSYMHLMLSLSGALCFAWFLLRWKINLVEVMTQRSRNNEIAIEPGKIDMISKMATMVILLFALLAALELTGRNMNTLIAFGGVGGLAIAFASQEIIANFFGGLMIYVNRPFAIGDWINLPEKNLEGNVEEIGWYMTRIRTFEKRPIYVPNSTFSKIVVMTPSRMSHRRFKEIIGIRYDDLPAAKTIIKEIREMIAAHPDIDNHQRLMVNLNGFGDYAIRILVDAYILRVDTVGHANVREDILFKIAEIVIRNKAQMAFPTTSLDLPKDLILASPQAKASAYDAMIGQKI